MSTTTTSVSTTAVPEPKTGPAALQSSEPDILARERDVLRQILRLVAERSREEAKVEGEHRLGSDTAGAEYKQARLALVDKVGKLDREARTTDEKRRRSIVDTALEGEAQAKAEFAAASRKIATMFDAARFGQERPGHRQVRRHSRP